MSNSFPLILRKELFGGIIYDSNNGTFLELDEEGFSLALQYLNDPLKEGSLSKETQKFIKQIFNLVPINKSLPWKFKDPSQRLNISSNQYYSAPTLVDFQITNQCFHNCPHCYANSSSTPQHAPWDEIQKLFSQMKDLGVFQVALGGGDPLLHPHFTDILYLSRECDIVPNVTLTGHQLTDATLRAMKKNCGAVALSLEYPESDFHITRRNGYNFFNNTAQMILDHGIPLVFQIVLSANNIYSLPRLIDLCMKYENLYGIIFLSFKPKGRGTRYDHPLYEMNYNDLLLLLNQAISDLKTKFRVGFDCCFSPSLVGLYDKSKQSKFFPAPLSSVIEGCSATRSSLGINWKMEVQPCTFTDTTPLGSLVSQSLLEIWHNYKTLHFQKKITGSISSMNCKACPSKLECMGGCPEMNLVPCYNKLTHSSNFF